MRVAESDLMQGNLNTLQSPLACLRTLCPHKKLRKDMRDRKDMKGTNYT